MNPSWLPPFPVTKAAHDVSGEPRIPAGTAEGGQWTAGGTTAKATPRRPQSLKEWGKIVKEHSEQDFAKMADRLIAHVGEDSFEKQVEWQSQNYQFLRGSGMQSRPQALRARAALETFAAEEASRLSKREHEGEVHGADARGASAGHQISTRHEDEAWRVAWEVANKA